MNITEKGARGQIFVINSAAKPPPGADFATLRGIKNVSPTRQNAMVSL
jgi:hypothetical protein